jgi:hypothetical protein
MAEWRKLGFCLGGVEHAAFFPAKLKDLPMTNAPNYRAKAAEFAVLSSKATSLDATKALRKRAQALTNLAENEEWVVANKDKIISNRAPRDGRIGHQGNDGD